MKRRSSSWRTLVRRSHNMKGTNRITKNPPASQVIFSRTSIAEIPRSARWSHAARGDGGSARGANGSDLVDPDSFERHLDHVVIRRERMQFYDHAALVDCPDPVVPPAPLRDDGQVSIVGCHVRRDVQDIAGPHP